ncbi:DUF5672 family protein [Pedobacter sp. MC2016-24]|uniref:DUF5672 family protein n=1 Tax=Pedobacter sp. MC2016-24 TaxID=2780090 RepID=UPI001882E92E|nr:DUF5672 family protein [Pedobacter sp. MC2016-24]MBE9598806.1 hypothetical protein [Pedobacter sp. MC2016-24]
MSQQVAIVIPFYKNSLSYDDAFALNQCFKVLSNYPIIAIKPKSLNVDFLIKNTQFQSIISFEDKYFKDIHGYNELMLSSIFYKTFLNFEYILIYQLDAFVFSDQLSDWCKKDYDYIGAPWLYPFDKKNSISKFFLNIKSLLYKRYNISNNGLPKSKQLIKGVGNGGLSLRRVKKFHDLSIKFKDLANQYLAEGMLEFNEDIFWSVALNRKKKNLHIPNYKIALKFSVETYPELAFKLNHNQLPFGCHAWDKHLDYWKPILLKFNYKP